jgi:hypothetical protein
MQLSKGKTFEQAPGGLYLGTIVDVVDMPNVQTQYGPKNKVRIQWILNHPDGRPAMGKATDDNGQPKAPEQLTVAFIKNASLHDKAELFKMIAMILGTAPPVMNSTEQLAQLLIGRSNQLFLTVTPNAVDPNKPYTNVSGVSPLTAGQIAPLVPQGFVRQKDKVKTVAGPNGQPAQTYVQPPAQATQQAPTAPVNLNANPNAF